MQVGKTLGRSKRERPQTSRVWHRPIHLPLKQRERLDQTGKTDVEIARKPIERVLQTNGKELAAQLENAADIK
jgi:hypothetical protein